MDLIVRNAKIITIDRDSRVAEALAVAGGCIVAVGAEREILALADQRTRVIDAGGRAVVPGLIDAHAHMDREGLREALPSLGGCRSVADIVDRIAQLARAAQPGDWIVTMPVGEPPIYANVPETLAEKRYPNRHDLDRAAPRNPVYIRAIWGPWRHQLPLVSIANSLALEIAGVGRDTVSPSSAIEIERDPKTGEPTGVFRENMLYPTVELTLLRVVPRFTHDQRVAGLRKSMRIYNSFGTTSVFEGHGVAAEVTRAYQAVRDADAQTVRAHLVFSPSWRTVGEVHPSAMLETWAAWLGGRGLGDDWLRIGGVFAEVDESAENLARAASLPYTGWSGFFYDSSTSLVRTRTLMAAAARAGVRVVGIKPNILGLFAQAADDYPIAGRRWVLGHINLLGPDDIRRARELGLVLTTHTNRYIFKEGSAARKRLGPDGERTIVPLKSLLRAGVPFALGSDNVPVSLFQPIWQAVSRKDRSTGEVVVPDERLSRAEALRAATMGGAFLTMEEDVKGSLEPGKLADFAVLTDDPLTCPEDAIRNIASELTVVGGRVVFDRGTLGG